MNLKKNITPLPHQEVAKEYIKSHRYVLVGDEQGIGKTLEAIISILDTRDPLSQAVIICPAFLKYNWESEFNKFTEGLVVKVVNGLKDLPEAYYADIIIGNYARLDILAGIIAKADFLVADECHYLKNVDAIRTKTFHEYVETYRPKYLAIMSGTPIKNRVIDFYSLLKLLANEPSGANGKKITDDYATPEAFAREFSFEEIIQFKQWSPQWKKKVTVKKSVFKGLRNEDKLRSFMASKYIRRLSDQVMKLPQMHSHTLMVSYKSKDTKLQSVWEEYRATPNKEIKEELQTVKRKSAMAKAPFSADVAKNHYNETGEQVIVFSDHIDSTELIASKLKVPFITGSTPIEKRNRIVQKFIKGDYTYFVATICSANTGLNLVNAGRLIFNDLNYTPSENSQALKRIHRKGQTKECTITYVVGSVIDEKITNSLREKEEVIKKIV